MIIESWSTAAAVSAIALISDIHLGTDGPKRIRFGISFNALVCAGDMCEEAEPERAIRCLVEYADGKPVVCVCGNHDFYTSGPADNRTMFEIERRMRAEAKRQNDAAGDEIVNLLSAYDPVCEIDRVRFIGLTLWSEWMLAGRWMPNPEVRPAEVWAAQARAIASHPRTSPAEYCRIRTERGVWTPYDAVAEHAREKAILLDELCKPHDGPTVVVTHHPPLAEIVDVYRDRAAPWWTPAFYVSDVLHDMSESLRPDLWICGHVHAPCDIQFGRTRVVANPVRGGGFNANMVVEV